MTAKPSLLSQRFKEPDPSKIPQILKDKDQWVAWKPMKRKGKITKPPIDPKNERFAEVDDKSTWSSFEKAWETYKASPSFLCGIGYVFTETDGLMGFDLDGARNPETGEPASWARGIIKELDSFTEISPSGTGYHVIVKANIELGGGRGKRVIKLKGVPPAGGNKTQVEIFKTNGYFTIIGGKKEIEERASKARRIIRTLEFLHRALVKDEKLQKLWSSQPNGIKDSEDDAALLLKLSHYTQKDRGEMKRLALLSNRVREKWYEKRGNGTWLDQEIESAISFASSKKTTERGRERGKSESDSQTVKRSLLTPGMYRLTEGGNGQRFADTFRDEVRFCNAVKGGWFVWNGQHWEKDDTLQVHVKAKQIVRGLIQEAAENEERRDALLKHARRSDSQRGLTGMLNYARSEEGIPVRIQEFDQHRHLFNLLNGTYNTLTDKLLEHQPANMLSKVAPINYDPTASSSPSLWLSFLSKIFCDDQELIDFIQRAVGYSLTGDTSERCIFFLHGGGRNGKSTLLSVLQAMLGTPDQNGYSLQTPTETLMQRKGDKGVSNDIARLKGARLVTASESSENKRLDEGLIKQLAGGEDTITARFLHGEFFEYKPEMKLWFASNHKPQIRGTDDAIWDRIRLIPFNYRITEEEKDPALLEKLKEELPEIFNWALEGLRQWRAGGLKPPSIVKAAVKDYRKSEDILGEFLEEHTSTQKSRSCTVAELYQTYKRYCDQNGEKTLTQRRLGKLLRERGYSTEKGGKGVRYWRGLGIITEAHRAAGGEY